MQSLTDMSTYFPTADEMTRRTIFPGVVIGTCTCSQMMLSVVNIAANAVVEEHEHPHEQVGIVLAGKALFIIDNEQKTLQAGDLYRIPGGTRHKVIALDEPVKALDVFSPPREDYR
jgi:quercetin dioxygenase-like cupin family protein